ncbi:MAG: nitrophenyl compound nitroreductase subunit ArsF family protein [Bacteroidota bacterium]
MKKLGFLMLAAILTAAAWIAEPAAGYSRDLVSNVTQNDPTEVYYFHMTRRCMTCQTVEKVAEQSIKELYPDAVKKGNLTFKSVNIEEKDNKALVKKLKIGGQTLLIVNGKDRYDITDKGFMYAVNEPEKLKAEIKLILDKYVK